MSQERIQWIDNEKGFVLLGVCLGHIGFTWNVFPYISTFHVAAFFFLSGILFRPDRTWSEFFKTKCRNLLLPYIVLSLFFLVISPPLYQLSAHYPGSTWQNRIADLFTDSGYLHSVVVQIQIYLLDIINGHSAPYVTPLWFVYTLFQLNIVWFYPLRWLSSKKYGSYILAVTAVLLFVAGWQLYMKDITPPLKLSTLVTASAFFIGGFLAKKYIRLLSDLNYWYLAVSILLLTACYTFGVMNMHSPCIGYILNLLDSNILAYSCASWGGIFLLTLLFILFNKIDLHTFIGSILRLISLNGIAILALHNYILSIMRWASEYFCIPILANHWIILIAIIISCIVTLPLINKYLYFTVGKKKPQNT